LAGDEAQAEPDQGGPRVVEEDQDDQAEESEYPRGEGDGQAAEEAVGQPPQASAAQRDPSPRRYYANRHLRPSSPCRGARSEERRATDSPIALRSSLSRSHAPTLHGLTCPGRPSGR